MTLIELEDAKLRVSDEVFTSQGYENQIAFDMYDDDRKKTVFTNMHKNSAVELVNHLIKVFGLTLKVE